MPKARPLITSMPGRGQLAAEFARNLAAVGAGAPGADDRHRAVRLEPIEEAGVASPDQRPRRVGSVPQSRRVDVTMRAAGPALRRHQLRRQVALVERLDPAQQLPRDLRRETDMGSPLMVRTVAKAAATGTAAVSSVSGCWPGAARGDHCPHDRTRRVSWLATVAKALPRNLIIVGLVLLALGIAAASQSADLFGVVGLVVAAVGGYLVTFGTWQLNRLLFTAQQYVTCAAAT